MKLWSREQLVAQPFRLRVRGASRPVGFRAAGRCRNSQARTPALQPQSLSKCSQRSSQRGLTLIECLVYIAVLGLLLNLATHTFFKCLENSRDLQRNADDVVRALRAGERWREDVRRATAPPVLSGAPGQQTLRVPQRDGEITYTFIGGKVWRDTGRPAGEQAFLSGVAVSEMVMEKREQLTAWRWELELETRKSAARVRPLFTFMAVSKTEVKQ